MSSANALVSGIIAADVESVWGKVKAFTSIQDFILPTGGQRLISEILVSELLVEPEPDFALLAWLQLCLHR